MHWSSKNCNDGNAWPYVAVRMENVSTRHDGTPCDADWTVQLAILAGRAVYRMI